MIFLRFFTSIFAYAFGHWSFSLLGAVVLTLVILQISDWRKGKQSIAGMSLLWFSIAFVLVIGWEILEIQVLWVSMVLPFVAAMRKGEGHKGGVQNG